MPVVSGMEFAVSGAVAYVNIRGCGIFSAKDIAIDVYDQRSSLVQAPSRVPGTTTHSSIRSPNDINALSL